MTAEKGYVVVFAHCRSGTLVRRKHLSKGGKACKMKTKIGTRVRLVAEPEIGC
jgi:hypothetical protein